MNRKQRRAYGIKEKEPVYQMTPAVLERLKKETYQKSYSDAADTALVLLLSIPICVLHEFYDWTDEELLTLSDYLIDEYQRFCDGEMTLEQYQDYVCRLTGLKFQKNPEAE